MPTPFPYNRISTPPVLISGALLPILNNVIQGLITQSTLIENIVSSMPFSATCDDADIQELRNRLESLLRILNSTSNIIPIINTVLSILRILSNIGQSVASASALVTPTAGAAVNTGQAAAELSTNALTTVSLISNTINRLVSIFPIVLIAVQSADAMLNSICNENNNNSEGFLDSLAGTDSVVVTVSQFESAQDLLDQFPSLFYTELNVSDEDLNNRYQEIVKLIDDGFDVINNLVELPSKVLTGSGSPADTIGTAGDFYINTQTNQLFGPKPTNQAWT